jgi:hypothetical protein
MREDQMFPEVAKFRVWYAEHKNLLHGCMVSEEPWVVRILGTPTSCETTWEPQVDVENVLTGALNRLGYKKLQSLTEMEVLAWMSK